MSEDSESVDATGPETEEPDWEALYHRVSTVFTPASPIVERELFSGRIPQVAKVLDAINQRGQHAVLYGERGVGKTSLANVLAAILKSTGSQVTVSKINCDAMDDFPTAWRKALGEVRYIDESPGTGFTGEVKETVRSLAEQLPKKPTPHDVRLLLSKLPVPTIVVFDEFDRLRPHEVRPFTDVIKALSDYSVDATIVLVGVASTIDQLVKDHLSIERAIVQVHLPRMPAKEIREILKKGAEKLAVRIDRPATEHIVHLAQGLPHYAHLVGLHAIRTAVMRRSLVIQLQDVERGVQDAVQNAQQSTKTQYHQATTSSHRAAIFPQVLLACALAHKDQLSYFPAAEVARPLSAIMGKPYRIPAFARHLNKFCEAERGPVLERIGPERRQRYRFCNPLLEPFVIMNGLSQGTITKQSLAELIKPE
jgi:Holliday junction resolvasome RuvABC ATP-dependent DNA helicase subunit